MANKETERKQREDALVSLYEESYERVARYIFVRIGNRDEAEDLASEVFLKALNSLDTYEERGLPMVAWVFRIAHNIVVDYLRKTSKKQMVKLDDVQIADPVNPEEIVEYNDEMKELSEALTHLSPAQREVIGLRFFSGLNSNECGEILGKKAGAVREMQSAAIRSLRQALYQG